MSAETDLLLDRGRLKRRLAFWRVVAIVAVLLVIGVWLGRTGGALPRDHVARLNVTGIITSDRGLIERVRGLGTDASVRAVVLFIDSPGGSVAGGEALHDALATVAARKPLVAVMGGTAASAGYMIAMPAARVFASDATLTGSIGVLLPTAQVSGLLDKLGIQSDTIVSGPLKDQPSLTRPLSDEGRRVLQGLVMDLYDQFVAMVAQGRHMTTQQVRALADGRAYTGHQALGLGLIDQIGGEPEARTWLATARGVAADLPIEDVRPPRGWAERVVGEGLGSVLELSAKSLFPQYVSLDGAWAIWHP
jgi:protease-4